MTPSRENILGEISGERDRQYNLPGSEYDQLHGMNDWIAIAAQYLTRCADKKHTKSDPIEQRGSLIKAAAVIVAAIEHLDRPRSSSIVKANGP
jgi:hypothetical protein